MQYSNDGNAFHIYYRVHCRVFLSSLTHHHLLKRTNTTKCQIVKGWQCSYIFSSSLTLLIALDTLQEVKFTARDISAKQCNAVCNSLRCTGCVALVHIIQQVENNVEMMPAIHITQGCPVPNQLFNTRKQKEKTLTCSKLRAINVGSY